MGGKERVCDRGGTKRRETNRPKLFPWLLLQQTQGQTLKVLMARRPWSTLTFCEGFGYLINNSLSSNSVSHGNPLQQESAGVPGREH